MQKYTNRQLLVLAVTITIAAVFTLHVVTVNDYKITSGTDTYEAPVMPTQKSLYQEIEDSNDRHLIEDIQDVRTHNEVDADTVQKVGTPVSFYSMPAMKFNVRYERASFFRSAPRCDLPVNRSWEVHEPR